MLLPAQVISIIPFGFSILIEIFSPCVSGHFNHILSSTMEDLEDEQIGSNAETEVKYFAEYAFDILQMYTALAVTLAGLFPILLRQNFGRYGLGGVIFISISVLGFVLTRDIMDDPALYISWKDRWHISPLSISTILINFIIIFIIIFL